MDTSTVFLVDDHPVFRLGLRSLINSEDDLEVVGEAADAATALEALSGREDPDLVVIDVSLPDLGGLELLRRVQSEHPGQCVLVVSMHDEDLFAERAVRAGACGYLQKDAGGEAVLTGIRRALRGELVLSPRQADRVLKRTLRGGPAAPESPLGVLTDRELEVFELVGRGRGTREIAETLGVSVKTIETHKAKIKTKLGLRHATELTRAAVGWLAGLGR